jgi:hypothetical protein
LSGVGTCRCDFAIWFRKKASLPQVPQRMGSPACTLRQIHSLEQGVKTRVIAVRLEKRKKLNTEKQEIALLVAGTQGRDNFVWA